jgi:tetratricopeptide (TPR) repeat protein
MVRVIALQISDGLKASKRVMEIGGHLNVDVTRSYGEILSSLLLVYSGSVTEGLRLADQARQHAKPGDDPGLGSMVAWVGGATYKRLGDPREAQGWFTSELAKPRIAQSAVRQLLLQYWMVGTCIDMGELAKARSYLADLNAQNRPESPDHQGHLAELLFIEGEWELAGKTLTAWSERSRATGNRMEDVFSANRLARLHRFTGERAQALEFLQRALDISLEGGGMLFELATRAAIATIAADAGDSGDALPHLQRCREIVSAGENWRGLAGGVERAEAVMAAAQGAFGAADGHFERGEEFVRTILRETEGNPFFIEETLRHLAEAGSFYRREGRWVTDASIRREHAGQLPRLSRSSSAAASACGKQNSFGCGGN